MLVKLLDYAPARLFQNTLEPKMSNYFIMSLKSSSLFKKLLI